MKGAKAKALSRRARPAGDAPATGAEDTRRLIHELRVHEVELQSQNRELREAKDLLEESRARYSDLYDQAPVAYVTFDRRGIVLAANLAACALLSTSRGSLLQRPFRTFLSRDSRKLFDDQLARCFAADAALNAELRVPARDGDRIVELVTVPSFDARNDAEVCHAAAIDVTVRAQEARQRASLLKEAQAARAMAEHASRAKEEFLAQVSHELRTPLVPMLLWVKVLESDRVEPALRRRALEIISDCVRAQTTLIDDLLDTARGTYGKMKVERQAVDLRQIVDDVVERSSTSATSKHVEVRYQAGAPPALVSGDERRLGQVVGNLLSNAIKFSRDGGKVEISVRETATSVVLRVRDEGEGIASGLLPLIFEPFRQQESREVHRNGGLGLGLFIVRNIVELHGGTIAARSAGPGRGAAFTVTLPRAAARPRAATRRQEQGVTSGVEPRSPRASQLASVAVLVVDDHSATRDAVSAILQQQGATTAVAGSAAQGREALARLRPDVLISDLSMLPEDGHTFIRRLRAEETASSSTNRIAALALSAHVGTEQRQRALDAGFDRYLTKPVDADELVKIVAGLADLGGARNERSAPAHGREIARDR